MHEIMRNHENQLSVVPAGEDIAKHLYLEHDRKKKRSCHDENIVLFVV